MDFGVTCHELEFMKSFGPQYKANENFNCGFSRMPSRIAAPNYNYEPSERRGGSVVSASDLGPEGREFEPWPVHPRCVLRQKT